MCVCVSVCVSTFQSVFHSGRLHCIALRCPCCIESFVATPDRDVIRLFIPIPIRIDSETAF